MSNHDDNAWNSAVGDCKDCVPCRRQSLIDFKCLRMQQLRRTNCELREKQKKSSRSRSAL